MTYKFDKPRPGESLSDYLVRHKAHPKLTPPEERLGMTDEEAKAAGMYLPDDHPVYRDGMGIGFETGKWRRRKRVWRSKRKN